MELCHGQSSHYRSLNHGDCNSQKGTENMWVISALATMACCEGWSSRQRLFKEWLRSMVDHDDQQLVVNPWGDSILLEGTLGSTDVENCTLIDGFSIRNGGNIFSLSTGRSWWLSVIHCSHHFLDGNYTNLLVISSYRDTKRDYKFLGIHHLQRHEDFFAIPSLSIAEAGCVIIHDLSLVKQWPQNHGCLMVEASPRCVRSSSQIGWMHVGGGTNLLDFLKAELVDSSGHQKCTAVLTWSHSLPNLACEEGSIALLSTWRPKYSQQRNSCSWWAILVDGW